MNFFDLSFDEQMQLYKDDPQKFDEMAYSSINNWIDSLPKTKEEKLKLRQLQFRIQGQLRKYKDPIARLNKMVELFWEGVNEFKETLTTLKDIDISSLKTEDK